MLRSPFSAAKELYSRVVGSVAQRWKTERITSESETFLELDANSFCELVKCMEIYNDVEEN